MFLPNLIVIGARKCATTSMHYYLNLHDEIFMSETFKELNFFVRSQRWEKGLSWYKRQFPISARVRGESSPNYTRFPMLEGVPERMHSLIPDTKLIYMVRDPVEQVISAYHHDFKSGSESRTLEEIMKYDLKENPYIYDASYYFQLKQFLNYYSDKQILVVAAEHLKERPFETMQRIFKFLGVDSAFRSEEFNVMKNVLAESVAKRKLTKIEQFAASFEMRVPKLGKPFQSAVLIYLKLKKKKPLEPRPEAVRPVLEPRLRERLCDYFKAGTMKLREWTGQPFEYWSV